MRYFHGHQNFVPSLAFSPDGRRLASAGADTAVRIWDVGTGQLLHSFCDDEDWACAVAFSPDGERLLAGAFNGSVRVWDVESREPVLRYSWVDQGRLTAAAWSLEGRFLAWSSYKGGAVCDLEQGPPQAREFADEGNTFTLRIAPHGRTIATAGTGPAIVLRRLATLQVVARLEHGDPKGCWGLAFSPNGRTLAIGLAGGLQLWDLGSEQLTCQLTEHGDLVSGVTFTPDGRRLLTCSWDQTARLYEFDPEAGRPGRLVGSYDWDIGKLFDVAVSPDGMLAAAGGDRADYLVVWDLE